MKRRTLLGTLLASPWFMFLPKVGQAQEDAQPTVVIADSPNVPAGTIRLTIESERGSGSIVIPANELAASPLDPVGVPVAVTKAFHDLTDAFYAVLRESRA